jgi:FtsP/CotA-like multicopper oxidase with cupredoxin domain
MAAATNMREKQIMTYAMARHFLAIATFGMSVGGVMAQSQDCPARPYPDTEVRNPLDLIARNGVLKVPLTLRSREMMELPLKVCYVYDAGSAAVEAPTLRLDPGDRLELSLTDRLTYVRPHTPVLPSSAAPHDPCAGGAIETTSTNIDFHGLNIPPDCHQGEVSSTTIENTDPAFDYRFQVPADNPPGMYWYHPHLQGSTTLQLNGGASGVLIVSGMEKAKPEVAGLPERILIVRQQFDEPDSWPPGDYRLTLNFHPAAFPQLPSPVIRTKPGVREFWRVANATSQAFLALQLVFGKTAQQVTLIALDGVPVQKNRSLRTIDLPPGGRAEFIVTGPPEGQQARLLQTEFETGRTGFENPPQELARIVATDGAEEPPAAMAPSGSSEPGRWRADAALAERRVTTLRKLYFAEAANGTNGPTKFFLTVEGQAPRPFDASAVPAVVTKVGAVEDWIVANHSGEIHAFHMHRIHFLVVEANGQKLLNPELRDTVTVPAWNGAGPYPTVKLRMDFRDPRTAGTFEFQCQIPHHAEAGMISRIQVIP